MFENFLALILGSEPHTTLFRLMKLMSWFLEVRD
jgi:hypothetical protein